MGQTILILLLVAAVWGAFILPDFFSSRRSAPLATTQEFNRWANRIATVQRVDARTAAAARSQVLARRRRTLFLLAAAAIATLGLAIWQASSALLLVHIAVDGALAWYLAMLVQIRHRRTAQGRVTAIRPASDMVPVMEDKPDVRILISS
jgi:hypothetical protein